MNRISRGRRLSVFLLVILLVPSIGDPTLLAQRETPDVLVALSDDTVRALAHEAQGSASAKFIENVGQFAEGARFQVQGGDGTLWLADDALWITVLEPLPVEDGCPAHGAPGLSALPHRYRDTEMVVRQGVNLRLSFVDASPNPRLEPFDRLETTVSYFIGNDPGGWRPDVPVWGGVRYVDLYPGIDLEVTSENGKLVQRVYSQPGADLSQVRLRVEGAEAVNLDGTEGVRLSTAAGDMILPLLTSVHGAPNTQPVVSAGGDAVYDIAAPFASVLVSVRIPQSATQDQPNLTHLVYSTLLGVSDYNHGTAIAVNGEGHTYVSGWTDSPEFPVTPGAFDTTYNGGNLDAFVAKLDSTGSALLYATYLGGESSNDDVTGIAVDESGNAYVTGNTASPEFPVTPGAFDTTYNGGDLDAFVAKLNPTGSALLYASFLGGSGYDSVRDLSLGIDGSAYITGRTESPDFPVTSESFDTTHNGGSTYYPGDAYVVRLAPTGSHLIYATFLGGSDDDSGKGIAVDDTGDAYITGSTMSADFPVTLGAFDTTYGGGSYYHADAFVAKLNSTGSSLSYAAFLGGASPSSDWWSIDAGWGIAVDESGNAYVTGEASSLDFPVTSGAFDTTHNGGYDAFVAKVNPVGSGLLYATYLGGSQSEWDARIAVDDKGASYVTGRTGSSDFPVTPGALDVTFNGRMDAFVAKLNPTGDGLVYATFLGGSGDESSDAVAVDEGGNAYVTGMTKSYDFPVTPGAFDTTYSGGYSDAFVARLSMDGQPLGYSVSGRVQDTSGTGISGVAVSAGGVGGAMTDSTGSYTITGLITGTYSMAPVLSGYTFEPPSRQVTVPPDMTGQDFTGQLGLPDVDIGFRPDPHGYSFDNWTGNFPDAPTPDDPDLTVGSLLLMFGEEAVCWTTIDGECLLRTAAAEWQYRTNLAMNAGHCDGMSVTSLRFYKGLDVPGTYQDDAESAHELLWLAMRRHISYYQALQFADPVHSYIHQVRQNSPSTILTWLYYAIRDGASDPTTLFFAVIQPNGEPAAHAVTPYAIEARGDGVYWVHVYDNEHSDDETRHVVIDTTHEIWIYDTGKVGLWTGNDTSQTLGIVPISLYAQQPECPWWPSSLSMQSDTVPDGQIWLSGGGHLLMTNAQGQRIGYVGPDFVNEIPEAFGSIILAGTGTSQEPIYTVPLSETYAILLDGQTLTQTEVSAVTQFGLGYAAWFDDISVAPTTEDHLTIGADGTQLTYAPNEAREVTMSFALDDTTATRRLQIQGADVDPGQVITLTAKVDQGKLVFNNANASGGQYTIDIDQASESGEHRFVHARVDVLASDTHYISYGAWDGSGTITIEIDHDSDGVVDQIVELENEMRKVYLPVVLR